MAAITPELIAERIERFGKCYTIDDVVRLRARDAEQTPILGVPRTKDDPADYEYFTGADMDRMVDEACHVLVAQGIEVASPKTVTIYAPSDLSFCVVFFALIRLGRKALLMSPRLGSAASLSLLAAADSDTVIYGASARITSTLEEVAKERPGLHLLPMLARSDFDKPGAPAPTPFVRDIADRDAEHVKLAMMCHSSGSTGMPKPLLLSHRTVMSSLVLGTGLRAFNSLPWYHIHGLFTSLQAMWMARPTHLFNPHLPLTAANLVAALRAVQPEICHGVPYALGLIAEEPEGIEVLKKCRYVTSAGAQTPDELGDRLTKAGVNLGVLYGLTETGHVGDSICREPGTDDSWAYMRPYPNVRDHIKFQHVEGDRYELIFLGSHPGLMMSNSNDPPNSYYSKDLFVKHPTIDNAYKYISRLDDRLTLVTGEKILPLAIEGAVRQHPLVKEALMIGNDRAIPGLLVFRAQEAAAMTEDEFLDAIWPAVDEANAIADEFARITRATTASIAFGVEYPATDKSSIIRSAAYAQFARQIDAIYARLDGTSGSTSTSTAKPAATDEASLVAFIMDVFATQTGIALPGPQADFFVSGVDSLRAIQARRIFQETLDFGEHKLPTNVVYDARNAQNLARLFHGLLSNANGQAKGTDGQANETDDQANGSSDHSNGTDTNAGDSAAVLGDIVAKFSSFDTDTEVHAGGESVLLTGATGALGAHILYQLLHDRSVAHVTCLVRGPHGLKRIHESLATRGLDEHTPHSMLRRLTVLETSDLGAPLLGLQPLDYDVVAADTTLIIHAAWPVHFGLSVSSFEPHIAGLHNLLQLSLEVPARTPARVLFASSIATAFNYPRPADGSPADIPEGPLAFSDSAPMGYAQSKLAGEHVCDAAARQGANVAVLRIGQITGDTDIGVWNDREAIPLLVQSALELQALPLLSGESGRCEWTPVDIVASAFIEIAQAMKASPPAATSDRHARYYNINSPHVLSWNDDVLPALKAAGLSFESVTLDAWLDRLRARGDELGPKAAVRLPALKLTDHYANSYADSSKAGIRFGITRACHDSPTLAACPNIAEANLIGKYLASWLKGWNKSA